MKMFAELSIGVVLITIALTSQYLLTKRVRHAKVRLVYSWLAWACAYAGGVAVAPDLGNAVGLTALGAFLVSCLLLLFIAADLADRRPDWLAFILICVAPAFMRGTPGPAGDLFDLLLLPGELLVELVTSMIGV